jgi:glutaredoxin
LPSLERREANSSRESLYVRVHCILADCSYPPPYVVELDIHPHGPELQAHLGKITGRRTVPNVLVDGVSIGGGDEMRAMEGNQAVASTLLGLLKGKITVDGKSSD